ncbi:GDPD-domain-containing protein [Apiospora sp. TS-2023a]
MLSASHPQSDPDWKWKKHQPRIRHLFYDKKLKPEEIRDRLRALDFAPSIKELKDRLESWGYRRNDSRATREYISHKVEKRHRQDKRSAVLVNGVQWTETKVRQQTTRNPRKMLDMVRCPSPSTPPGPVVSVCSPTSDDPKAHIFFEWPPNLPWLRFTSLLSEAPIDILGMMCKRLCRAHSEPGAQDLATSGSRSTLELAAGLLGIPFPHNVSNPLELSAHLRSIMPEIIPGEHLLRSQNFIKGSEIAAREALSIVFYQLSNKSSYVGWRDNKRLVDMISQSGLVGLDHPILLEPTVRSVLEEIGIAALCCCRSDIVTWILDLGIKLAVISHHNPLIVVASRLDHEKRYENCCPYGVCDHTVTVSDHDGMATIKVLLNHGVSPDDKCCQKHGTPLEMAIRDGLLNSVKVFVEHGRRTHGRSYLQNLDFSRLLLIPCWNTPLAKQYSMLDYLQVLFEESFQPPVNLFGPLLSTDGIIRTALHGGPALFHTLRAKGADFNCNNFRGEHPLGVVVAARSRLKERCKGLIAMGASVNYSPIGRDSLGICPSAIHIASLLDDTDTLADLLENGPCEYTPASFYVNGYWVYDLELVAREEEPKARSPLGWALWTRSHACARLLLKTGCPVEGHELLLLTEFTGPRAHGLNIMDLVTSLIDRGINLDMETSSGKTALDIAIFNEQFEIANILILGGATKHFVMSTDISSALGNCGWLDHLKRFIIPCIELYTKEDCDTILDDWCRSYPCDSIRSQDSRLGDLSEHLDLCNSAHLMIFKFVLERYRHAYSSRVMTCYLIQVNEHEYWDSSLPIIYELMRRKRPQFVTLEDELWDVNMLVDAVLKTKSAVSACLLTVLEVLLQQNPALGQMNSYPWENPLATLHVLDARRREVVFDEAMQVSESVQNMLLGSGFTVNTAVGLRAICHRCTTDELKELMCHGYDPRKRYRWSNTALQLAAMNNDIDMVRFLLDQGVNVNGRPRWGELPDEDRVCCMSGSLDGFSSLGKRTAFQYAVENNNWECIQLLFEYGADVNASAARRAGATALQLAVIRGCFQLALWLISEHADILAPRAPFNGMTAIEAAAAFGRLDIVALLFNHGNFRDGKGRRQCIRAVGYARNKKYEALRSYMEDHIGWSQEEEDILAREDLLESVYFNDDYFPWENDHEGCAYETESVDEGMDEPECCRHVDSENREYVYRTQWISENEYINTTEHMLTSQGGGASTSYEEENAPCMVGEDQAATAALAYNSGLEGVLEDHNLGIMDLGFLPDSYTRNDVPDAPGLVIGEISDNGEWFNEPIAPALYSEWTDPDDQRGWTVPSEDVSGNQLDFSHFI